MVKHVIVWKLKEDLPDKDKVISDIKRELEGLIGKIDGLIKMNILTEKLPSSSGDIMMDSLFSSETALKNYSVNPLHQSVANTFVRPFIQTRLSFDFNE